MKKIVIRGGLMCILLLVPSFVFSATSSLSDKLAGRILLQVEDKGQAYYVNPKDKQRIYLGRPVDAFNIMKELGVGITNIDLEKIPVSLSGLSGVDIDGDGLPDAFEDAVGTDKNRIDTDSDAYNDKTELETGYYPIKKIAKISVDENFANQQRGKILLQVEGRGEAWYVNPVDGKRYFLGRPIDAFNIMRSLGLGISNNNLNQISVFNKYKGGVSVAEIDKNHLEEKIIRIFSNEGRILKTVFANGDVYVITRDKLIKLDRNLNTIMITQINTVLGEGKWAYRSSHALDVDANGNVYVAGDQFIIKFNSDINKVLGINEFPGVVHDMTFDFEGNVYVAGVAYSENFPTIEGAYNENYNGGPSDGFIVKFSNSLNEILAATYIGGKDDYFQNSQKGYEAVSAISLDPEGNIYVAGYTQARDFPTTEGAFDQNFDWKTDYGYILAFSEGFVVKLNSDLSKILASTYIGSEGMDNVNDLILDANGNVYVAGYAPNENFPITEPYSQVGGKLGHGFVAKMNSELSELLISTRMEFVVDSLVMDSEKNIYVGGDGRTLGVLNSSLSEFNLSMLSEVKDSHFETILSLDLDNSGNIYASGYVEIYEYLAGADGPSIYEVGLLMKVN